MNVVSRIILLGSLCGTLAAAEERRVSLGMSRSSVRVTAGDQLLAEFRTHDELTSRPFFCNLHTPAGALVSRPRPLPEGELSDHAEYHPGVWMAFGDLSGADDWRLKAPVRSRIGDARLSETGGRTSFTVNNTYLSADGITTLATEQCVYSIDLAPTAWRLRVDSTFSPGDQPLVFGDQEEMGLGVRLRTAIAEKSRAGGRILDSEGRTTAKGVWGKSAAWCDYSGVVDGRPAGITIVPSEKNFRPAWWHVRDYGVMVANPFGRQALTRGEPSRIEVAKGETLRLRFDVIIHDSCPETVDDVQALIRLFATGEAAK